MTDDIKKEICQLVSARRAMRARELVAEIGLRHQWLTKDDIKLTLIELSANGNLVEFELLYKDRSNESVFCPKGTKVRK